MDERGYCCENLRQGALIVRKTVDQLHRTLRTLSTLVILAVVAGCASPPPPPPKPTVILATVKVEPDVNPDRQGRASPIVIRFYELKTLAAFSGADFFSLWNKDRETLGADLVAREEFHLRPGERKSFDRTLEPDTRHLAVIAAFRDLDRARWRDTSAIRPNKTSPLIIKVEERSISISASDSPAAAGFLNR